MNYSGKQIPLLLSTLISMIALVNLLPEKKEKSSPYCMIRDSNIERELKEDISLEDDPSISVYLIIDSSKKSTFSDYFTAEYHKAAQFYRRQADVTDKTSFYIVDIIKDPYSAVFFEVEEVPAFRMILPNGRLGAFTIRKSGLSDVHIVDHIIDTYEKYFAIDPAYETHISTSKRFDNVFWLQRLIQIKDFIAVYIGNHQTDFYHFSMLFEYYGVELTHCSDEHCAKYFNIQFGSLMLVNNTLNPPLVLIFPKSSGRSDIHKYIYEYEPPKLNLVSEYTGVLIFKKKKNALIFFIDGKTDPNIKIVSAVSEALSKNIIIVVSFNETYIEDRLKVKMKKNDGIYPAAWIAETTNHQLKRYKMKDAFTYENIILFYEAFVHKLLVPEINSEDPLISYDIEGRVTRLVGANFNDKVYNVSEDVVVYLYASWDEFSSRVLMEPFENAVEREFISKKASNIKFYKIDVYNNELEYVDVNLYGQFPRLLVFNKQRGDDEPLDFFKSGYGDVSIDAMVSFIKENTDIVFP